MGGLGWSWSVSGLERRAEMTAATLAQFNGGDTWEENTQTRIIQQGNSAKGVPWWLMLFLSSPSSSSSRSSFCLVRPRQQAHTLVTDPFNRSLPASWKIAGLLVLGDHCLMQEKQRHRQPRYGLSNMDALRETLTWVSWEISKGMNSLEAPPKFGPCLEVQTSSPQHRPTKTKSGGITEQKRTCHQSS